MERNEKVKIVYLDAGISRVIRGILMNEDDFCFTIKTSEGYDVKIGKTALVKLTPEEAHQ